MAADRELIVDPARLDAAVRALFAAAGSGPREAELVAAQLVGANLAGHDSHGVGMIPRYIEVWQAGELHLNRSPERVLDAGALAVLDAGVGLGQVAGHAAMLDAVDRARRHGAAIVGLRHAHHVGRIGHWAEMAVAEGLVSLHFVNVISNPVVAPFGGRDARLVTNPVAIGVPRRAGRPPLVLDFATSRWAVGKVRVALNQGKRVPDGVLLDVQGQPTTDPAALFASPNGALLPFGEHKGAGLGLMCEILGSALFGGPVMHGQPTTRCIVNNMLSIVVDPVAMGRGVDWIDEVERVVEWVQASPPSADVSAVRVAGEPEDLARRQRAAGVPIDAETWRQLGAAADAAGLGASAWAALCSAAPAA